MSNTILAVTGHRPDKLGRYDEESEIKLVAFAVKQLDRIREKGRLSYIITGMALGWDQAIAAAAYELGIPFHAYIPFRGQELRWNHENQRIYHKWLEEADKVVVCSPGGYAVWKMQVRNEMMVDKCTYLLALWDGSAGGTANCVGYATESRRPLANITNCWDAWRKFQQ